jgi:hypothetical protein
MANACIFYKVFLELSLGSLSLLLYMHTPPELNSLSK